MPDIANRVTAVLRPIVRIELGVAIEATSRLRHDLHLDALDVQTLVCNLEEEFLFDIPDTAFDLDQPGHWVTVNDVITSVRGLLASELSDGRPGA